MMAACLPCEKSTPALTWLWSCHASLRPPALLSRAGIPRAAIAAGSKTEFVGRAPAPVRRCPAKSHCPQPRDRDAAPGFADQRLGPTEFQALPESPTSEDTTPRLTH